jgi:ribulose-bisphosphate carboxylase large chain
MSRLVVHYKVASERGQIAARAESLLLEQTVELSRAAASDEWVRENIIGEILSIDEIEAGLFSVAIAQPTRATALDPAQFLNVAFGNSSLQPDVTLAAIEPSDEFLATFKGPRFGAKGLREKLGVFDRALTATALKPMGLSPEAMASLAYALAVAGIDNVKDDHSSPITSSARSLSA